MEHLRYVARAQHMAPRHLVRETARALSDFVHDEPSLLIACNRVVDRQPTSGALVWLIAHVLGSPADPQDALWDAVTTIDADQTPAAAAWELPDDASLAMVGIGEGARELLRQRGDLGLVVVDTDGSSDRDIEDAIEEGRPLLVADPLGLGAAMAEATHLVLELDALGPEQALARQGALAAAATAQHLGISVWALAPTGTAVPGRMYDGLTRRWHESERAPLWERSVEELDVGLIDVVVTAKGARSVPQALSEAGCPIVPELF